MKNKQSRIDKIYEQLSLRGFTNTCDKCNKYLELILKKENEVLLARKICEDCNMTYQIALED